MSADKRQRPKWERVSAAHDRFLFGGVEIGAAIRDFQGDWVAIHGNRPIERCSNRVAARRAVKTAVESASVNPKTEAP